MTQTTIIIRTIGDFENVFKAFPPEWPVQFSTKGGGYIVAEHRQTPGGKDFVAIYNDNGGRFGENPLTEEEYKEKSLDFLSKFKDPYYSYTTRHGDHRIYHPSGRNDTCYGCHYDRRVIERMVKEGLVHIDQKEIERVAYLER